MKWRERQLSFLCYRDFDKQQFISLFELRIWGYYQDSIFILVSDAITDELGHSSWSATGLQEDLGLP